MCSSYEMILVFLIFRDTVYSVEELVGMIFNNSRHIAEAYAGKLAALSHMVLI